MSRRQTLVVVGAGPKGLAVGVKAKVLEELGVPVERVVLIEKHQAGATWSGRHGYTNGEMKLGTSPEKDLVFPLATDLGDEALNRRARARQLEFSWASFLVQTGRFSDWIDRGRPPPPHRLWAEYLGWVAGQLAPQVFVHNAEVASIALSPGGDLWELSLRGAARTVSADRLMLTGPGKTRAGFAVAGATGSHPGLHDIESFWAALQSGAFARAGRVAIVGAGENAASVLLALSRAAPGLQVEVITPRGFLSSRAESSYENRFFSQPAKSGWRELTVPDRLAFIERTDLGVFSQHAMQVLNDEVQHQVVPGRLIGLEAAGDELVADLEHAGRSARRRYDQVVIATGFDPAAALTSLLTPSAQEVLERAIGAPLDAASLAPRIQEDLSVRGVEPPLHLPALGALTQGPGFSNLSCLGLLSDRVLLRGGPALEQRAPAYVEARV